MDRTETVASAILGGIILLVIIKGMSGSGSSTKLTTLGPLPSAPNSAAETAATQARTTAFGALASATTGVETSRLNDATQQAIANVQAGVEQSRIAAAENAIQLQVDAQKFAIQQQTDRQKNSDILNTIGNVVGGVLSLFGI